MIYLGHSDEKCKISSSTYHVKVCEYDVIRQIFGDINKEKLICNSPNDIISRSYDNKKVDEDENFSCKARYISSLLRVTQI